MASTITLVLFTFLALLEGSLARDEQCDKPYTTLREVWRSTANKEVKTGVNPRCDRNYIIDDTWYRFDSPAGNEMPTTNPGFLSCGTFIPLWLNGRHPTVEENRIDGTACARLPRQRRAGCGISYNIKVVNCGGFYLYQLKNPYQCSLAYCAGSKLPEECSLTGEKLPVCPGVVPRVKKITASVYDEEKEFVRLKCVWEYDGIASFVEFHVRWIGDEFDPNRRIEKKFSETDQWEYLYEHEWAGKTLFDLEPDRRGFTFNKEVFCEIRSKYKDGSWSKWTRSNKIFTGITVYPNAINLDECGKDDNRKVFITLTPHLPIRLKRYKIDIRETGGTKGVNTICIRGITFNGECRIQLTDEHGSNSPLRIMILTSCSQFDNSGETTNILTLEIPVREANNNNFWQHYEFPKLTIFITRSQKKICKSETDPHFTTFDGRKYDFMGVGTFLLYYNKHVGVRVEARQKSCGSGSCNCGIAIKEGPFYKILDMCQVDNTDPTNPRWWTNPKNLVIRKRELQESKMNGFYTLKTMEGSTTTYEIYLPSGVMVTIKRKYWGLSTYIKAPTPFKQDKKNDDHYSEGLCGNYNGDSKDDFQGDANQFGESNRIRGSSIFDYKGDKSFEEKVVADCKDAEICSCSREKRVCGVDAIAECFPSEKGAHHTDINKGLCSGTTKRDLAWRDDDIDDQDDIPPFNPPLTEVTQSPSWPTPSGHTEVKANEICDKTIRFSKAGESCAKITGVDIDSMVKQCISDIQAMDDVTWANENAAAMQDTCERNIYKNTSFYKKDTDGQLKFDTAFIASLCPNDCSNHGKCSNSTCTCDEDYTAADCSISVKDSPFISGIRKSGLCDVRRRPCRNVGVYGFPFLDSESLTCHVQEFKVIESVWTPSTLMSLHPGKLVDLTEVKCSLPESPVNIGEYSEEGVTAAGLKVAVSNNGINASKEAMLFITYDSICQECNTTTGCRLKTDACFIFGHCFAQSETHPTDWCRQCLPHISRTSWVKRRDNQPPRFTTSALLFAFRGKPLRVQLRAIDPEYRTLQYSIVQRETFGASLTERGMFTWTKRFNDATRFLFKVSDECGAYSVLRATVLIKRCPCRNSGKCNPDYRYLDGAGHFTCTCPPEYTGALCDVDVDECSVSKPCLKGRCNNKQPGFSCSCFAGYTGELCGTEIDECASNPCFIGVPCTDMVAAYKCGPCPNGYTGNGENCNRIDGKVDECVKNPQICHNNAKCEFSNGGAYVCQCTHGFSGDGKNSCTDVNECDRTSQNGCSYKPGCMNTPGSYRCTCPSGYSLDSDEKTCIDVDECSTNQNDCSYKAGCQNAIGSYLCTCPLGYFLNGDEICQDINECNEKSSGCTQTCTNTIGGFSCSCNQGYYLGEDKKNCIDVDECKGNQHGCQQNCENSLGSYECRCRKGFTLSSDGRKCSGKNRSVYLVILLVNKYHSDVLVTTNVTGNLVKFVVKPKSTVVRSKILMLKETLILSAVDANTNQVVNINGQSVVRFPTISISKKYALFRVVIIE